MHIFIAQMQFYGEEKKLNTFLNEIIEAQKCRKDAVRYVPP